MKLSKSKLKFSIITPVILMISIILITSCEKENSSDEQLIPVAAFSADVTNIDQGTTVEFTDQSTQNPISWEWNFGDGSTTSTDQNPEHMYTNAGSYTVILKVSNENGYASEMKDNYITVNEVAQTVTDIDGNVYQTIAIGNQVWMTENLKVTRLPAGTEMVYINEDYQWSLLNNNNTDKAYCYYNNNANSESETYGALYTWAAAMNGSTASEQNPSGVQGICPDGWHIPSADEWWTLINTLGGKNIAGGKLKEVGTDHWNINEGATNESGFTALPGGYRGENGSFYTIGNFGYWWSTSEEYDVNAWSFVMNHMNSEIDSEGQFKSSGKSVRCVKD